MDLEIKENNSQLFTNKDIKDLKKSINNLQENEYIEIFKIIKKDTDKYTENRNGIFINMSKLQNSTLLKVQKFVKFCNENRISLNNNLDKMEEIRDLINNSNINDNDYSDINKDLMVENENHSQNFEYLNNTDIKFNDVEQFLFKESIKKTYGDKYNKSK